jgi:hypothetical protein
MKYSVYLNHGNEYIGANETTITVNEVLETVDEQALAREISHENPLIPVQVAKSVLENFCKAAAQLMSMGFAIQLKNGNDVALRIHPDIHVKGGNINLARAKELDPTVTELTKENAGDLVDRAGVVLRAKAECEPKFTELLLSMGAGISRKDVIERAMVARKDDSGSNENNGGTTPTNPDTPSDPGTGGGGATGDGWEEG